MMQKSEFPFTLAEQDKVLFSRMQDHYNTPAEKKFFQKMAHKQKHEPAFSNELLVFEQENPDGIYLIRKYYDTYLVGYTHQDETEEFEVTSLTSALSIQLNKCIGYPLSITLWEWLRKYNYEVVRYNRNYDIC